MGEGVSFSRTPSGEERICEARAIRTEPEKYRAREFQVGKEKVSPLSCSVYVLGMVGGKDNYKWYIESGRTSVLAKITYIIRMT